MSEELPIAGSFVIRPIANCSDFSHELHGTIRDARDGTFTLETVADGRAHTGTLRREGDVVSVDIPALDHRVPYTVKPDHHIRGAFCSSSRSGGAEFYFTHNT